MRFQTCLSFLPARVSQTFAALIALCLSAKALTVHVDPANGAPRLVVDGKPVRARMFFGIPGSAPVSVSPEWREIQFEFTPGFDANDGTMHFRFGQEPGEIFLDDIQVTDLDAGSDVIKRCDFEGGLQSFSREWTSWPVGSANTVGSIGVEPGVGREGTAGLRVTLKAPADGVWPDFHIYHHTDLKFTSGHRYRVSLWVRATPARKLTIGFYKPGKSFVWLGGPQDPFSRQIKLAGDAGADFVSCPMPGVWPKPGEAPDWSGVDAACSRVLLANPHALLIPRIGMDPPKWWCDAHPDDLMQWEDGHREKATPASPRYRRDAAEQLAAFVAHLEEKFGDHVAGYHPVGQNTGEWFYQDSWKHLLSGYSSADLAAWRLWLKQRYGTDQALRRAWNDTAVTLDTAAVPTPAARHAAPAGVFRDPSKERSLIDWAEFQQIAMADCVCDLAHAARQASRGQKLVLFFYGYLFEFAALPTAPSVSGHYALRRALECPDIDVLCSPISYFDRGLGGGAPSMSAAESVALAGKMWLNEDDTHTYLATGKQPGWDQHVNTLEDTNKELVRNVAQEALRNFATWWMDLGATGWFDDPGMWREMARLRSLDEELLRTPTAFHPEVAAVIDERAMCRVAEGGALVTRPGIYEARRSLGRMGAPYGQYLLIDVLAGKVHAKVYALLDAWALPAADRQKLLEATRGSLRIWCGAPGYFDGDSESPEAMRQLTGFQLQPISPEKAWATPTEAGRKLGLQHGFGVEKTVKPLLAAMDAKPEEILATYPDGSAAVAMRRDADGVSLFVGAPGFNSELLRLAAREAGAHLFTQTDCNVYANGSFVALHASQDGSVELDTGKPGEIRDVLNDQVIGHGPVLSLPLLRGETRVLKY
jgi:beta-galactosidase